MPDNAALRAVLASWRIAAASSRPPSEEAFVTADVNNYLALLCDAFTLDVGPGGDFYFRFIGSSLAKYIGREGARNRLAFSPAGTLSDLVRRTVIQTVALLAPHYALGRAVDRDDTFEVICVPVIGATGGLAVFGAGARPDHDKLPSRAQRWRVEIEALIDLEALEPGAEPALKKARKPPPDEV